MSDDLIGRALGATDEELWPPARRAPGRRWELVVRDKHGAPATRVESFDQFEANRRVNDAGGWLLDGVPLDSEAADLLRYDDDSRGAQGILLRRDGVTVFSGRVVTTTVHETTGGDTLDVTGLCDTGRLAGAYISPEPTSDPPFDQDSYDSATFPTESLLYFYAGRNLLGPGTLSHRRNVIPELRALTDSGRGTTQTRHGRLQSVLEFFREIAAVDGLIFEILYDDDNHWPSFGTRMPADLRGQVVFSRALGSVHESSVTESPPAVTHLLGLGAGAGADRVMAQRSDEAGQQRYGRWESVKDARIGTTENEILDALEDEFANGRGGVSAAFTLPAEAGEGYDRDYRLGDQVTVLAGGLELDCRISEVVFRLDERGATVTPTASTTTAAPASPLRTFAARAEKRLRNLEANAEIPAALTTTDLFGSHDLRLWWGDLGTDPIPAGWQVADGTNGTPDLRGYVLYGAGTQSALSVTYTLLQTIGANARTVDIDHSHSVSMGGPTGIDGGAGGVTDVPATPNEVTVANDVHEHVATADALGETLKTVDIRQAGRAVWILARSNA